jgi:hypothetical protein
MSEFGDFSPWIYLKVVGFSNISLRRGVFYTLWSTAVGWSLDCKGRKLKYAILNCLVKLSMFFFYLYIRNISNYTVCYPRNSLLEFEISAIQVRR